MQTYNAENERIKRQYFLYLKEAKRYNEATLDGVAKALNRFEVYTKFRSFKSFHIEQAVGFKRQLSGQLNARTGKPLSKATLYSTLSALRNFFHWLAGRPGFRSRLSYSDADYFNLSDKETRVAKAHREQRIPTLEQIRYVVEKMPTSSDIERRNRALIAFTLLTGMRDRAITSLKLKHLDIESERVVQDAREVRTKFSKTFTTYFFPVGDDMRRIVFDWIEYLQKEKLWGPDDPVFPATHISVGSTRLFQASGLERKHWNTTTSIRRIFKDAFTEAGLPYFNPHSFRKTLAQLGEKLCRTPEEFKAWSQNLGHEKVLTTFSSYGEVGSVRQAEIIIGLGAAKEPEGRLDALARELIQVVQRNS